MNMAFHIHDPPARAHAHTCMHMRTVAGRATCQLRSEPVQCPFPGELRVLPRAWAPVPGAGTPERAPVSERVSPGMLASSRYSAAARHGGFIFFIVSTAPRVLVPSS